MLRSLAPLVCFLGTAHALYQHEAGVVDWYAQNIDTPTLSLVLKRNLYLATKAPALAKLDLRTGDVTWRKLLPQNEVLTSLIATPDEQLLVTASLAKPIDAAADDDAHALLRLWHLNGTLSWEVPLKGRADATSQPSPSPSPPLFALLVSTTLYAAFGDELVAVDLGTGRARWRKRPTVGATWHGLSVGATSVHALGVSGKSVVLFDASVATGDGSSRKLKEFASPPLVECAPTAPLASKGATTLACFERTSAIVWLVNAADEGSFLQAIALSKALPNLHSRVVGLLPTLQLPGCTIGLALRDGGSAVVSFRWPGNEVTETVLVDEAGPNYSISSTLTANGGAHLAITRPSEDGARLVLSALELDSDGQAASRWSAPATVSPLSLEMRAASLTTWLNAYPRKDGTTGYRLLLLTRGGSLSLVQPSADGGRSAWTREEALARIQGAVMLPLGPDASVEAERPYYLFAGVRMVAQRLKGVMEGFVSAAGGGDSSDVMVPDAFGYRQVVVVRTEAGKLFGLDSKSGAVLWSRVIEPRENADAALPRLVALLPRGANAAHLVDAIAQDSSSWQILSLDPLTGRVEAQSTGEGRLLHASRLPERVVGDAPVMLVDETLRVRCFPELSNEAREALRARVGDVYFHVSDPIRGGGAAAAADAPPPKLRGYRLASTGDTATPLWTIVLPAGTTSYSTAYFPTTAAIHSPVRARGDRSVLHKYLNPHAVAVGLAAPGYALAMLVDSVSGHVLHTARHEGGAGPLALALSENSIALAYWSVADGHHMLSSTELYAASNTTENVLELILGKTQLEDFDSLKAPPPLTASQTYGFPTAVAAMAVTVTRSGVTPRQLLVATAAGQLVSYDPRLLDPRRPMVHPSKMSQADREEGLVPYSPTLGAVNPLQVVSHGYTVARPRAVVTAPSHMESTSMVLVYGLDIFFSRVAAARTYDQLGADFNKLALVLATGGLLAATYISGKLSAKRDLAAAWK